MFDLSWAELLFVGVLAIVVIGPKDLPGLFRAGGRWAARGRKLYSNLVGSVHRLEKEVDLASGKSSVSQQWQQLVPEELRNLPDDFIPGSQDSQDAQWHQQRREAFEAARRRHHDRSKAEAAVRAEPTETDEPNTSTSRTNPSE